MISADIMPSSENITFDSAQLDANSNYNVSVMASNVAGSAISYTRLSECCVFVRGRLLSIPFPPDFRSSFNSVGIIIWKNAKEFGRSGRCVFYEFRVTICSAVHSA